MENFKKISSFIIVVIFLVSLFLYFEKKENFFVKNNENAIKYVKIGGATLKVDLASTQEQQEKGLSIKENLNDDEGMLFIFKKPSINYFWMKDMRFPIDIIWIGKDLQVVYIEKNVNPDTYPHLFGPNEEVKYVLEVNAGFSEKNNLKKNDNVFLLI
jgi:uncharacterized membrane protein (UPF0127 family)